MKFAHELQETLRKEGFPPDWTASTIPYGALKKLLKKIQIELETVGLSRETLALLTHQPDEHEGRRGSGVAIQYDLEGKTRVVPKLTIFVQLEGGEAVDAVLSPETKKYLEELSAQERGKKLDINAQLSSPSELGWSVEGVSMDRPGFKRIEIPLLFDTEFFDTLHEDVIHLDLLQTEQRKYVLGGVENLSTELVQLAQPMRRKFKDKKTDLYRWRELFEIYLQAGIFFSTHEQDHGARNSMTAARQLNWFQAEVEKRGLASMFTLPESRRALVHFVSINIELLRNLKYRELNQKAISKILKKFDKRTQLGGAAKAFPKLIQSAPIMSESIAKDLCAQINQDIVKIVPQLDDYSCPICSDIVWRPVKLKCEHVLCSACAVKLEKQNRGKSVKACPLCRKNVVVDLREDDVDEEMIKYIELWFPKEVRQKRITIETEQGREALGIHYKHPSEQKCVVM